MFSKSKQQQDTPKAAVRSTETQKVSIGNSASNNAGSNSQKTARPAKAAAPSIFSSDLIVEGTLHSEGDIQIDGRIEGNIKSGSLTIGEKAVINGELVAKEIIIRGRVIGSIRGNKVQLSSTSHVEGDILHNALAVESGAFFDGNCRHADDPLTAEAPMKPVARPTGGETSTAPGSSPIKSKPAGPKTTNGLATDDQPRGLGLRSTPPQ